MEVRRYESVVVFKPRLSDSQVKDEVKKVEAVLALIPGARRRLRSRSTSSVSATTWFSTTRLLIMRFLTRFSQFCESMSRYKSSRLISLRLRSESLRAIQSGFRILVPRVMISTTEIHTSSCTPPARCHQLGTTSSVRCVE